MARVPYRTRADARGEEIPVFERLEAERRMPTPNVFLALANAPRQLDGLLTYARSLREAHELGARLRELVILAIAYSREGDYIALHHERDARQAGYTTEQIRGIREGESSSGLFSDIERAVVAIGTAIGSHRDVTQEQWDAAAEHLTARQLVQLAMTASWYAGGTIMTRLLGLDIEDELSTSQSPGHQE